MTGSHLTHDGARFEIVAPDATNVWVSLFDADDCETLRLPMERNESGRWHVEVKAVASGQRYGFRADGPWKPREGHWFDPARLLVDPMATRIDRPYKMDPRLAGPRGSVADTAALMPKAVLERVPETDNPLPVCFMPGGLIYEVNVRGFSMLHPDVPEEHRGTLAALRHPSVIAHFKKIGVSAVELMPVVAWIDERHLGPLGLTNAWGYNPVTFSALDPRLAPGGISDLKSVTDCLRDEGISVFLDLVFNHTGESDELGPVLSLRGLMGRQAFRRTSDGRLVNDAGTGNTVACDNPLVMEMILQTLRHFVLAGGVDGFRFDLAPILGRTQDGFSSDAPLLQAMMNDPVIGSRVLIAEPWDIGPGGYQLGNFPSPFLEWNDAYRDDVRRFWRGDAHALGAFATRLAGSSDIFNGDVTRSVNFLAAHDGFTLADLVSYKNKHNEANGEGNRDGHNHNISWNNGAEGPSDDPEINEARKTDIKALLTTLFLSRGTIMLTAGDEFGRTQGGNNNGYAQDNATTWIDWNGRDRVLEAHVAMLASLRSRFASLASVEFLTGEACGHDLPDVQWLNRDGTVMSVADWEQGGGGTFAALFAVCQADTSMLAVCFNRLHEAVTFRLPKPDQPNSVQSVSVACRDAVIALCENGVWEMVAGGGIEPPTSGL